MVFCYIVSEWIKLSDLWWKSDWVCLWVNTLEAAEASRGQSSIKQGLKQTHNSWISLPIPFHVPVDAIVWTAVFIDCLDWFFWDLWVDRIELWMRQYLSWPWATNAQPLKAAALMASSHVAGRHKSEQAHKARDTCVSRKKFPIYYCITVLLYWQFDQ